MTLATVLVSTDSLFLIMSVGLDAHQIANECEQFIEARIQQHIRELEAMPVTMGDVILSPAMREHQREQQSNS